MATTRTSGTIYQLKVKLSGSKPPIWRRMLAPASTKLSELHRIIQAYMGWEDDHLHAFERDGARYSSPTGSFGFALAGFGENDEKNEERIALKQLLTEERQKLHYTYDFGDNWKHEIVLEKILPRKRGEEYPQLIAGKRRCPPEDCGGIWGYFYMLEALESPEHPEYGHYREWLDEDFDPEECNLDELRSRLANNLSAEDED